MQKLVITIHYIDDVEIDPVLIEDFVRDNYPILNMDADISEEKDPNIMNKFE